METPKTKYKSLDRVSKEVIFKEKKSKFFGYAFPIKSEEEVKPILEKLQKMHPDSNHICYAWQLGVSNVHYRANDDGEPNNSAGLPIYGQIQSFEVTNVLIAVVRIYGGVKLGVGGLIAAYRETAKLALENSKITEKVLMKRISISFTYEEMDTVMRFIKKHQLEIEEQNLHLNCEIILAVQNDVLNDILKKIEGYHKITVQVMD